MTTTPLLHASPRESQAGDSHKREVVKRCGQCPDSTAKSIRRLHSIKLIESKCYPGIFVIRDLRCELYFCSWIRLFESI